MPDSGLALARIRRRPSVETQRARAQAHSKAHLAADGEGVDGRFTGIPSACGRCGCD